MSIPHTGRLHAEIDGMTCLFDGDSWNTPDPALTSSLDAITAGTLKHHYGIREVAERVIAEAGLKDRAIIVDCQNDQWAEDLPPGAVD
jgi:hypothetical protein